MKPSTICLYCLVSVLAIVHAKTPFKTSEEFRENHGLKKEDFDRMKSKVLSYKAKVAKTFGKEIDVDSEDEYFDDVIFTPEQIEALDRQIDEEDEEEETNGRPTRKIRNHEGRLSSFKWSFPIRYAFDGTHNVEQKAVIRQAIAIWEQNTCIRFEESSQNEVVFTLGNRCSSYVGKIGTTSNPQTITLSSGCLRKPGVAVHEIGHTIGFFHEQSRPDRDDYVTIMTDNVRDDREYNYYKFTSSVIDNNDVPYDYSSVMHYAFRTFSKDFRNLDTIVPKNKQHQKSMGQRMELSFRDAKVANMAYCLDICTTQLSCKGEGYPDPTDCTRCRCPEGLGGRLCDEVAPSSSVCNTGTSVTAAEDGVKCIQSPNYNVGTMDAGTKCNWVIKAPAGRQIYYWFSNINFPCSSYSDTAKYCSVDWLEVRDQSHNFGTRYCCEEKLNKATKTSSNELIVTLRKNYAPWNLGKFKMCYMLVW